LVNADGLPALQTVDEWVSILYNRDLEDLAGMSSLSSIGGNVQIAYNSRLSNSAAEAFISGVGHVGGDVDIRNNSGR